MTPILRETILDINAATGQLILMHDSDVTCAWSDLVWAAITVRRRSRFDVLRFGFPCWMEIVWRAALLRANLITRRRTLYSRWLGFAPSSAFLALDGSEKGAVTYFLGLVLAKLAAERHCNVPWVLHLDVYSRPTGPYGQFVHVVIPELGRQRPDLVGESVSGDWLVLEAKGRTGYVSDSLRFEAKEQARLVSTINGQMPSWRIASIASFRGGRLALDLIDPADPLPEAEPMRLHPDDFLRRYYALPLDCVRGRETIHIGIDGRAFVARAIPEADLTIGIEKHLYQELTRHESAASVDSNLDVRLRELFADQVTITPSRSDDERIGSDGILVRLGPNWRAEDLA